MPGSDVPLFVNGSTVNYGAYVNDVVASSSRNAAWELDGYSNYVTDGLRIRAPSQ